MAKYLLPCECGIKIPIDVSQAGQQLECECGQTVEVPTLRGVRDLEQAEEATAAPRRSSSEWDPTRGMIFAGSIVLFLIGAGVAYFGYDGVRHTPNITNEIEQQEFATAIDDMSSGELYEVWQYVRDEGLGPHGQNIYVNMRTFRSGRQRVLTVGIVLCALGVVGAIGAAIGVTRR